MKYHLNPLLRLSLLCTLSHIFICAYGQQTYELKLKEDWIKIYSSKSENSAFEDLKGEYFVKCSIDEYAHTVADVSNFHKWRYKWTGITLIDQPEVNKSIVYTQISAPWPVSLRDLILEQIIYFEGKTLFVEAKSLPDYMPVKEDIIRIRSSYSKMTVTEQDNGILKVEFYIQVDPGGVIPAWISNLLNTQGPYESFHQLKQLLEE